jgi:FAD/FMN-containing dehydrogenase
MSRLPDIIEATKQDMAQSGLLAGICGHVGDGNFHGKLTIKTQDSADLVSNHFVE